LKKKPTFYYIYLSYTILSLIFKKYKMKKLSLFLFCASLLCLLSCKPNVPDPDIGLPVVNCPLIDGADDYLIFGTHHGFCHGNCTNLYKLTTTALFQDDVDGRFIEPMTFSKTAMSKENFALTAALCVKFPLESTNALDVTIGCPDCHDQGTVYVELKRGAVIRKWRIDPDQSDTIPMDIQAYAKLIKDLATKLKG
jgi:hypothetical protein